MDEGATLQFERCKYVKGARECGRFIPKSNGQIIFCDLHATLVANARIKKMKPPKPDDKVPLLVKHLKFNLDREKGAVMEENEDGMLSVRRELIQDERDVVNNSSDSDSDEYDFQDGHGQHQMTNVQVDDDESDVDDCDWGEGEDNSEEPDYDCLKNAGYFTVEEVVKIYRQKLRRKKQIALRLLELEKLKYRHAWRKYCQEVASLKRRKVNFTTDPKYLSTGRNLEARKKVTPSYIQNQIKISNETKAIINHRIDRGPRALLRRQVLNKRKELIKTDSSLLCKEEMKMRNRLKLPKLTCCFGAGASAGLVKCQEPALPLSRFCTTHIVEDPNQKLYKKCLFKYGQDPDDICQTPVLTEVDKFGCSLHVLPMPPKEPPLCENKKPKVEEDIEKIIQQEEKEMQEKLKKSTATDADGDEDAAKMDYEDEELMKEMEELVGDEAIDLDHFRESLSSIYAKGIFLSDSEESEDTEEEEEEEGCTAPLQNGVSDLLN